jgi:hypothetical protein
VRSCTSSNNCRRSSFCLAASAVYCLEPLVHEFSILSRNVLGNYGRSCTSSNNCRRSSFCRAASALYFLGPIVHEFPSLWEPGFASARLAGQGSICPPSARLEPTGRWGLRLEPSGSLLGQGREPTDRWGLRLEPSESLFGLGSLFRVSSLERISDSFII